MCPPIILLRKGALPLRNNWPTSDNTLLVNCVKFFNKSDKVSLHQNTSFISTQNKKLNYRRDSKLIGHYAVQGHSMSLILVPIESLYANCY